MELTAITFNSRQSSDRGRATALSIRQNFSTAVAVPEWVKGKSLPKDSPAAYAIATTTGKIITIEASFATDLLGPATVDVRADGGGVLGSIDPATITMGGGVSVPQSVPLNLPHHKIGADGILRQDIQWDWFYKATDGSWISMGSSFHRIYVVLDTPFFLVHGPCSAASRGKGHSCRPHCIRGSWDHPDSGKICAGKSFCKSRERRH